LARNEREEMRRLEGKVQFLQEQIAVLREQSIACKREHQDYRTLAQETEALRKSEQTAK
jgi:hypothetical protein